ncbi:MAG: DegT/DnrJ/EryC1/StrS family aminotransferase [Candidatus Paceibacterota bacterium]
MRTSLKQYQYKLFSNNIEEDDIVAVREVLQTGVLSRGQATENFEKTFAQYVGKKYAIAVSSGTAALHLAIKALGWREGDEVLTSPFTFISSASCLLYEKIKPIFIDIDKSDLNLNAFLIEKNLDKKVKGIILPYIFGATPNSPGQQKILKKIKLPIIEDACEAVGRASKNTSPKLARSIKVYSFFNNKPLTCGEGGMVATDDEKIAAKVKSLRDQGRIIGKKWADKISLGYNYRLTEMQAALATNQLKKLDQRLQERVNLAKTYYQELRGLKDLELPPIKSLGRSWFVFYVLVNNPEKRDRLYRELNKRGIECGINYFLPLYRFAYLKKYVDQKKLKSLFPNTEEASSKILVLPIHNQLIKSDIVAICNELKKILNI